LDISVLVVDDNSPDGTGVIAEELSDEHPGRVHVLHRRGKLGLRSAYLEGFAKAFKMGADAVVQSW
jgi:dolichol-phosphate mannosyltransferase